MEREPAESHTKNVESEIEPLENGTAQSDKDDIKATCRMWLLKPGSKRLIIKTAALYTSFLALGLTGAILGPSMVYLEALFDTDTKTISAAITGHGFGYLTGSFLCGVILERLHHEMQLCVDCLTMGLATIIAPWAGNLYGFMALWFVQGLAMGFLDTGGQAYCMSRWRGQRYKEPIMQALHGIWSVGATISPLILRMFMTPLNTPGNSTNATMTTETVTAYDLDYGSSVTVTYVDNGTYTRNVTDVESDKGIEFIRYGFLTIGVFGLFAAILYSGVYLTSQHRSCLRKTKKEEQKHETVNKKDKRKFRFIMLFLLFWFYFFYLFVEGTAGSFLAVFVIKGLGWSAGMGSLITSALWASHGIGRIIGVPLSIVLRPRTMLTYNLVFTLAASVLMSLTPFIHDHIMWVAAVLAGLGMATTFASMVLWASSYITIDGAAAAVFLMGASVGAMISAPLTGYLFDTYGSFCVTYILIASSIMDIIIFALLILFTVAHARRMSDKKHIVDMDETEMLDMKVIQS